MKGHSNKEKKLREGPFGVPAKLLPYQSGIDASKGKISKAFHRLPVNLHPEITYPDGPGIF